MWKKLLNEIIFDLMIKPRDPILVKSGEEIGDPTLPDMQFVRTSSPYRGIVPFIPGSSLKGVLRSHAERIVRTLRGNCCDLFSGSCGKKIEEKYPDEERKELKGSQIYEDSCLACRIFGSTYLAGRILFTDAYPQSELTTEIRTGIAIDRLSGAVAQGPFQTEVITSGEFIAEGISLRNFELWQVGLLGLALRDLKEGRVRIGFGKSRGFGRVEAELRNFKVSILDIKGLPAQENGKTCIYGVGSLIGEEIEAYGYQKDDKLELPFSLKLQKSGIWTVFLFAEDQIETFFAECVEHLKEVSGKWKDTE